MGESVAGGAGLDDVAVVGEAVNDGGAQSRVGEGPGPARERFVADDGHGGTFLPFGQHLEEELGSSAVELEVAELVDQEQVDAAVAGDGAGEVAFVGGFGELVDELRGEDVAPWSAASRRAGHAPRPSLADLTNQAADLTQPAHVSRATVGERAPHDGRVACSARRSACVLRTTVGLRASRRQSHKANRCCPGGLLS